MKREKGNKNLVGLRLLKKKECEKQPNEKSGRIVVLLKKKILGLGGSDRIGQIWNTIIQVPNLLWMIRLILVLPLMISLIRNPRSMNLSSLLPLSQLHQLVPLSQTHHQVNQRVDQPQVDQPRVERQLERQLQKEANSRKVESLKEKE